MLEDGNYFKFSVICIEEGKGKIHNCKIIFLYHIFKISLQLHMLVNGKDPLISTRLLRKGLDFVDRSVVVSSADEHLTVKAGKFSQFTY